MASSLNGKQILLVISGSIAAVKAPDILRLLRKEKAEVQCLVTQGGAHFITPMALASLSGHSVAQDIWNEEEEASIRHIRLARQADLILVAPASANFIAKMATGLADDLASTVLLAADSPVLIAPAMNHRMWYHAATQRNLAQLRADGIQCINPDEGMMACGESGVGRLAEPKRIVATVQSLLSEREGGGSPLKGRHFIVTAGPTHEPIDPVRYLGNRSSGKQGFAIAEALHSYGAQVTLIAGPVDAVTPVGVERIDVKTALEMKAAVENALPADGAILTAAVADWRVEPSTSKYKKEGGKPSLTLIENPDILAELSQRKTNRPRLVIGFAAESDNLLENAVTKFKKKGCDWIIANSIVATKEAPAAMGGDDNRVHLITQKGIESWDRMSKKAVACKLANYITHYFKV
ncbi:MAG: bifunctional phosphopantothenoylcysteine decarboxylase/phosphopantothenate--cysteine ligase CoaBC [Zymomonas mobilis subsp. pomaceae]|uniref:bifunctional phosphopantothenoylcysteine decarboxylase/phosphopantothenate--cysteine ligase CoaBC n=1 Tax=Zymomonas mobilis TaxID=542 RepID=UPI0039EA93B3